MGVSVFFPEMKRRMDLMGKMPIFLHLHCGGVPSGMSKMLMKDEDISDVGGSAPVQSSLHEDENLEQSSPP